MKKVALLVGVKKYKDEGITPLKFAAEDVTVLGEALENRCEFNEVCVLAKPSGNEEPTLRNILKKLQEFAQQLERDDLFLFHFSGHGVEIDGKGYLLTRETVMSYPQLSSLSLEMLEEALTKLEAKQRILLIDACRNSPQVARGDEDNLMADVIARDIQAVAQSRAAAGATTALLSACDVGQRAYEWSEKGHGVFTYYLLHGIKGREIWRGNRLRFSELANYTQQKVKKWSEKAGGLTTSQNPWFKQFGIAQDIILAGPKDDDVKSKNENNDTSGELAKVKRLKEKIVRLENGTDEILQPLQRELEGADNILRMCQEACTIMESLVPDDQKETLQTAMEQDEQIDDLLKLPEKPYEPYVYQLMAAKLANDICDSIQNNYEEKKRQEIVKIEEQLEPLIREVFAHESEHLESELDSFFDRQVIDIVPFPKPAWDDFETDLARICPYLTEIDQIRPKAEDKHDERCWRFACNQRKSKSYRRYIEAVPKGRHIAEAWRVIYLRRMSDDELRKRYLQNVTSPLTRKDVALALRSRSIYGAITGTFVGILVGYVLFSILLLGINKTKWTECLGEVMTCFSFSHGKLIGAALGAVVGGFVFSVVARYMGRRRDAFKWPNGFLLGACPGSFLLLIIGTIFGALRTFDLGEGVPETISIFCSAVSVGLLGGIAGIILSSVPSGIIWWILTHLGKGKVYNDLAKSSIEATRRISIGKLAKEIGVDVHAILERCQSEDLVDVKDPKSTVPANIAEKIHQWFKLEEDQQKTSEHSASPTEADTSNNNA